MIRYSTQDAFWGRTRNHGSAKAASWIGRLSWRLTLDLVRVSVFLTGPLLEITVIEYLNDMVLIMTLFLQLIRFNCKIQRGGQILYHCVLVVI
jgi:hypothetical protein